MKVIPSFRILLCLAATSLSAFAQGPLNPPAAPAPNMKTLDQIEARTPIPASPATPVAGPHFTITQPGSYFLTGNVTVSSDSGILITATSDVSIDLNGFTIKSSLTGAAQGGGIRMPSNFKRLTVCNGSIVSGSIINLGSPSTTIRQGFNYGIYSSSNLSAALIQEVHLNGIANDGIYLDAFGIAERCSSTGNGGTGIYAPNGIVTNCVANGNGGSQIISTVRTGCLPVTE